MVLTPERVGAPPQAPPPTTPPPPTAPPAPSHRRRRRVVVTVLLVVAVVLAAGGALFGWEWTHNGPHELSGSTALHRFRASATGPVADPGALHPRAGVYQYRGTGTERVSLPPKSQTEGPRFPGTISYGADGCWTFRVDYSDSHWQSTTYCARGGNLVETGRAGWYRWNFVALVIADTATFTCQELAVPAVTAVGQSYPFGCTGSNDPLDTGTVTMAGTTTYLGTETVQVGSTSVVTMHFREEARFGGGQTGTNEADIWMSTTDGLPVRGSWTTHVSTPSPLGTSVMDGHASFTLTSLTPRT